MATYQWIGVSGDWSTPADWSADAEPGPSDDAVIAAAGSYTVTVTASDAIGSVLLNDAAATLEVQSGGTLAIGGSLTVQSGTLQVDGGTLNAPSGMLAPPALVQGYGLFDVSSLVNEGIIDASIGGQYLYIQADNFSNDGVIYAQNGGIVAVNSYGVVDLLNFTNDGVIDNVGSTVIIGGNFTNFGTVILSGGMLELGNYGASWINGGLISAVNASIYLNGVTTTSGLGDFRLSGSAIFLNYQGVINNTGNTIDVTKGLFRSLFLNGGTIEGGTLITGQGGSINASQSVPSTASTLQNVAVLGGLTLTGNSVRLSGSTTIENSDGTGPGTITLNSGSYLGLAENYTFDQLNLNGGYVAGAGGVSTATIRKGVLVQGYGGFIYGPFSYLALQNDGTIDSNVNSQWLDIVEMPFANDGLVLASGGGNISIDYGDPFFDHWSNDADGIISVINGGTLQLGSVFTNFGLIAAVNSTVYFGDPAGLTNFAQNAGNIVISGGNLFLGSQNGALDQWTDSGLIATVGAAIEVLGSGVISAGGTMRVVGGSMSGQTTLEDDGQIQLSGGSIILSSLTIDADGRLIGFGVVANLIANLGIIDASIGKLDLGGAITGSGQLQINRGATLELGGATAEAVTFKANVGALVLDTANAFSGTVAGMAQGNNIDLGNFAFSSHPSITSVVGTGAAGSTTGVTVRDGSLTTTIQLLNQYANQFAITPGAYALKSDHPGSAGAGTLFTLASPYHGS